MQKLFKRMNDRSGMTLLEILLSLALLGLIVTAIFPLITQSLATLNSANRIASAVFANQKSFEIVAITEDGAYLDGGIIIPSKNFPNVFDTNNPVAGMTIKKGNLIRFLAKSIATGVLPSTYFPMEVYEGYTSAESVFTIKDDSFSSSSVVDLNGATGIAVNKLAGKITFTLPTINRLTNNGGDGEGNYIITITTGTGDDAVVKNAVAMVHLPRAVIAKSDGSLLIASSTNPDSGNWVSKTGGSITGNIKKIVFTGSDDEQDAAFIAIGDTGMIYRWANGGSVFVQVYTAGDTSLSLNDIIITSDGMLVVGDNGLILKSADGITWTAIRGPGTVANGYVDLNAITYFNGKYYCAGNGRVVLIYNYAADNWDQLLQPVLYPRLVTNDINSKSAIQFSGSEYLTSNYNPVSNYDTRTIFMVVKPTANPANKVLLSMGSASNYLTIRTDGNGRLQAKTQSATTTVNSSSPQLVNGTASVISCRISVTYTYAWYDFLRLNPIYSTSPMILTVNNSPNNAFSGSITMNTAASTNPIYLGGDPLGVNTGFSSFIGNIAEVLVFDSDLSNTRNTFTAKKGTTTNTYTIASYMDIVNYYLHLKYNISLLGTDIGPYYYGPTVSNITNATVLPPTSPPYLSSLTWNTWSATRWPFNYTSSQGNDYYMNPLLWVDASTSGSLDTTLIQSIYKVNKWKRITYSNPLGIDATKYFYDNSSGNALQAMAIVSDSDSDDYGKMYSGGYKRAMVRCDNLNVSSPSLVDDGTSLSTAVSGYSMDDMVYANSKFVAVLNSDTAAGRIYYFTAGGTGILYPTTYPILNDLFCYDPNPDTSNDESLFVVGNSGTILLYSSNGSSWTDKSNASLGNLLAGCLR